MRRMGVDVWLRTYQQLVGVHQVVCGLLLFLLQDLNSLLRVHLDVVVHGLLLRLGVDPARRGGAVSRCLGIRSGGLGLSRKGEGVVCGVAGDGITCGAALIFWFAPVLFEWALLQHRPILRSCVSPGGKDGVRKSNTGTEAYRYSIATGEGLVSEALLFARSVGREPC